MLCVGVLVDWDQGFMNAWRDEGHRTEIHREQSYFMDKCVDSQDDTVVDRACAIYHREGFFANLPPMEDGIKCLLEMATPCLGFNGFQVYLCTTPIYSSKYCISEKVEWVRANLGSEWVQRIIFTNDKVIANVMSKHFFI